MTTRRTLRWVLAFVALLLAAEVVARLIWSPLTPQVFQDDAGARVLRLAPGASARVHMFGRQVDVSIDDQGHRVTTGKDEAGSARALHVVGDSQVFGWGIGNDETLPSHLQRAVGQGWRVRNHGVPGYGPTQYRRVLASVPVDEPVVLLLTEENDLWDSLDLATAGSYCGYMSDGTAARWRLPCVLLGSRLLQLVLNSSTGTGRAPTPLGFTRESTVAARVASGRVSRWLREERARRGERLLVTVVPWRGRFGAAQRAAYFPEADADDPDRYWPDDCGMRAMFAGSDGAGLFLTGDSHLNAAGAKLASRCVVAALQARRVIVAHRQAEP